MKSDKKARETIEKEVKESTDKIFVGKVKNSEGMEKLIGTSANLGKKNGLKHYISKYWLLGAVVIGAIIMISGVILVRSVSNDKIEPVNDVVVNDNNSKLETSDVLNEEDEEIDVLGKVVEKEEIDIDNSVSINANEVDDLYVKYTNDFLGIEIDFPSSWYVAENTDKIINVAKKSQEDNIKSIANMNLTEPLPIVEFDARDLDENKIQVALSPYKLNTKNVNGEEKEVKDVKMELNDDIINTIDKSVKDGLKSNGLEISSYSKSYIENFDKYDALIMEYATNSGLGEYATLQFLIPLGNNNLIITAMSKNQPNDVDKLTILTDMLKSLKYIEDKIVSEVIIDENESNSTSSETKESDENEVDSNNQ